MVTIVVTVVVTLAILTGVMVVVRAIERDSHADKLPRSKRVQLARDDATVASYRKATAKDDAETLIVEAQRDHILNKMNDGDFEEAGHVLGQLERGKNRDRYA